MKITNLPVGQISSNSSYLTAWSMRDKNKTKETIMNEISSAGRVKSRGGHMLLTDVLTTWGEDTYLRVSHQQLPRQCIQIDPEEQLPSGCTCSTWHLGPVSRKSRQLFGPEKPFVKLQPAYSVKLVLSHVVKGIKMNNYMDKVSCLEKPSF